MTMAGACEYCGEYHDDLIPAHWGERTRWFCGIECLEGYKIAAGVFGDDILDGLPCTAKELMDKERNFKDEMH